MARAGISALSTVSVTAPVFVDFTAAWCLTCQVNERLVLSTDRVMEAFRSKGVTLFIADWTRQDSEITEALEALGRTGVPVYALYLPGNNGVPSLLPDSRSNPGRDSCASGRASSTR